MSVIESPSPGPLSGILVADFSRVLAGPLATMMLGDLGAEVVKVERPETGDETRGWHPPTAPNGQSTYFLAVNRNKRSIALDLSTKEGCEAAKKLALSADVLVENFAPGTMERFGLDYDQLAAVNPRLIYASVTGFGRDSSLPGYDFLIQAVGGLMSITGTPDGEPMKAGVAVVDVLAGHNLATGILAALYDRERTGLGQRVDINLLSTLLAGLVNQASAYLNTGVVPVRLGNAHPSVAPYQTLTAADGSIVVAVGNDTQFARLVAVLEAPALADDPRFRTNRTRVENLAALTAELEARLATRSAAEWVDRLGAAGVPSGVVNTVAGGFDLASSLGLDPVVRLTDDEGRTSASVANPIRLSRTPVTYRLPPPRQP
jgi:crotonobetainyl-CoA:carnitine CoA-transferase CaiB-like acyl-CoA transferase